MYRQLFAAMPAFLACPVLAITVPQDIALHDLRDPLLSGEIAELGGYQELMSTFTASTLREAPLSIASPTMLEFREEDLRVRIEALPFGHALWVERVRGRWMLEGMEALGWSPGEAHTRLSRVEAVIDGAVIDIPASAWTDVFDAPLRRDGLPFACVMRSRDGWRTYIHLQAGEGPGARMATWVIEDGQYLFRVVDRSP